MAFLSTTMREAAHGTGANCHMGRAESPRTHWPD